MNDLKHLSDLLAQLAQFFGGSSSTGLNLNPEDQDPRTTESNALDPTLLDYISRSNADLKSEVLAEMRALLSTAAVERTALLLRRPPITGLVSPIRILAR